MRIVGIMATTVVAAVATGAVVLGLLSLPDIKRYLKIRSM